MGLKKTPLVQKLRSKGGATMYVFPSASEDIGLNINNDIYGVALSHYALLNLPAYDTTKEEANSFNVYKDGTTDGIGPNVKIAESLQNYMMNLETLVVNRDDYNYQEMQTITEKVFWHWLKHLGAIGTNKLYDDNYNQIGVVEKDESTSYSRVVQCFGAIDAGNSLSTEFGMYNETYINIPTSYGNGPVYFESISDDPNYPLDKHYYPTDENYLEGRSDDENYFIYVNECTPYFDITRDTDNIMSYYDIDTSENDEGLQIIKDLDKIQKIMRQVYDDDSLLITTWDDINIDVNHKFGVADQFDFNAILLYYSVYDQNDDAKLAQATNLFGIIFLDSPQTMNTNSTDLSFYLPAHTKYKSTADSFGNSYSFRVNVKTMSVYDNSDAVIQDNTTMSSIVSNDFSDAISQLNRAIDIMNTNVTTTQAIQNAYAKIVSYYGDQAACIQDLSTMINAYIKGMHSRVLDTSILYVNEVRPQNVSVNEIRFVAIDDRVTTVTENIGNDYTEPLLTVDSSGISIENLFVDNAYNDNEYVKVDSSIYDKNVLHNVSVYTTDEVNNSSVEYKKATDILDNMFNSSDNVVIKLKNDESYSEAGNIMHEKEYNHFYVDPQSKMIQYNNERSVQFILDSSSKKDDSSSYYMNYAGFVPYIIAELQRMNTYNLTYNAFEETGLEKLPVYMNLLNFVNLDVSNFINDTSTYSTKQINNYTFCKIMDLQYQINKFKNQLISPAVILEISKMQYIKNGITYYTYYNGMDFTKSMNNMIEYKWYAYDFTYNQMKNILLNNYDVLSHDMKTQMTDKFLDPAITDSSTYYHRVNAVYINQYAETPYIRYEGVVQVDMQHHNSQSSVTVIAISGYTDEFGDSPKKTVKNITIPPRPTKYYYWFQPYAEGKTDKIEKLTAGYSVLKAIDGIPSSLNFENERLTTEFTYNPKTKKYTVGKYSVDEDMRIIINDTDNSLTVGIEQSEDPETYGYINYIETSDVEKLICDVNGNTFRFNDDNTLVERLYAGSMESPHYLYLAINESDIADTKLSVYVNSYAEYNVGAAIQLMQLQGKVEIKEFDFPITYYLYRSTQAVNGYINMQMLQDADEQ